MPNRWLILFTLFFARTVMAFQFQSVAALSPLMIESLGLTLVDIGLLIGLYLGPGVLVATLGGTVASLFGDKRVVLLSLLLMVLGGMLVAYGGTLTVVGWGRVASGIGGVVINVVMTKMVVDWFAGRQLGTAMGLFVTSWPLGIALSLLLLPALAGAGGVALAWLAVIVACAAALALFAMVYRPAPGAAPGAGPLRIASLPWLPLSGAAIAWGLYNTAFAMVFGFGALVLIERGLDVAAASSATSLYMLTAGIAIPIGGWLADRTGRSDTVIRVSLLGGVALFPALLFLPVSLAAPGFGLSGFVVGLGAGLIVSLPARVLLPEARAFGTGIFYSIYYLLMMLAPPVAGAVADHLANVDVAFLLGSGMLVLAALAHLFCLKTTRLPVATHAA